MEETGKQYMNELITQPDFSLEVDPLNQHGFSEEQKSFISHYVNYKNLMTAANLTGIEFSDAKKYLNNYAIQTEIRRINKALYHRQFARKLISLEEIGGYLSSLLTDEFIPIADQLPSTDKLKVVNLLLKLNEMQKEAINDPEVLLEKDIDYQIKELSLDTIKNLLSQKSINDSKNKEVKNNKNKKEELINCINKDDVLTLEEKAYLESLSTKELLKLLNDNNKKGGK